jgi:Zn-dependent protease
MLPTRSGSIRLFKLFGISVYLHWSWLIAAAYFMSNGRENYSSPVWNVFEYLSLFLIVLMHEFGHSLACRSVGGQADQIFLWPLGGVAYVSPPQRPGAMLWSIAAGPLVNVCLVPVLGLTLYLGGELGWMDATPQPDYYLLIRSVFIINLTLLIFNLAPIYPLDGGQILRSLLWFLFGRANSLIAAAVIGFTGMAGLILVGIIWAVVSGDAGAFAWPAIMSVFILLNCWAGLKHGLALARLAKAPRRGGFACPVCHVQPPWGKFWFCQRCRTKFDTFETMAVCPNCTTQFNATSCPECGRVTPIRDWMQTAAPPPLP